MSLIDLQVTLRLFVEVEPSKLCHGVYQYADRNGINDFYVRVSERSSIDLPMTLRLSIKIEPHNLGYRILLIH